MTDAMLFRKLAASVYGKRWKADFAKSIGIEPVTIWRHLEAGDIPQEWFMQVMKDAMTNLKMQIIAAQQKGIEFPVPEQKGK